MTCRLFLNFVTLVLIFNAESEGSNKACLLENHKMEGFTYKTVFDVTKKECCRICFEDEECKTWEYENKPDCRSKCSFKSAAVDSIEASITDEQFHHLGISKPETEPCPQDYVPLNCGNSPGRDECESCPALCPNGECRNLFFNTYYCECHPGYKTSFINGEQTCIDIDECSEVNDCPKVSTTCVNNCGSYECVCNTGFRKNRRGDCVDIDECKNPWFCDGVCVNTLVSARCICEQADTSDKFVNFENMLPTGAYMNFIGCFKCEKNSAGDGETCYLQENCFAHIDPVICGTKDIDVILVHLPDGTTEEWDRTKVLKIMHSINDGKLTYNCLTGECPERDDQEFIKLSCKLNCDIKFTTPNRPADPDNLLEVEELPGTNPEDYVCEDGWCRIADGKGISFIAYDFEALTGSSVPFPVPRPTQACMTSFESYMVFTASKGESVEVEIDLKDKIKVECIAGQVTSSLVRLAGDVNQQIQTGTSCIGCIARSIGGSLCIFLSEMPPGAFSTISFRCLNCVQTALGSGTNLDTCIFPTMSTLQIETTICGDKPMDKVVLEFGVPGMPPASTGVLERSPTLVSRDCNPIPGNDNFGILGTPPNNIAKIRCQKNCDVKFGTINGPPNGIFSSTPDPNKVFCSDDWCRIETGTTLTFHASEDQEIAGGFDDGSSPTPACPSNLGKIQFTSASHSKEFQLGDQYSVELSCQEGELTVTLLDESGNEVEIDPDKHTETTCISCIEVIPETCQFDHSLPAAAFFDFEFPGPFLCIRNEDASPKIKDTCYMREGSQVQLNTEICGKGPFDTVIAIDDSIETELSKTPDIKIFCKRDINNNLVLAYCTLPCDDPALAINEVEEFKCPKNCDIKFGTINGPPNGIFPTPLVSSQVVCSNDWCTIKTGNTLNFHASEDREIAGGFDDGSAPTPACPSNLGKIQFTSASHSKEFNLGDQYSVDLACAEGELTVSLLDGSGNVLEVDADEHTESTCISCIEVIPETCQFDHSLPAAAFFGFEFPGPFLCNRNENANPRIKDTCFIREGSQVRMNTQICGKRSLETVTAINGGTETVLSRSQNIRIFCKRDGSNNLVLAYCTLPCNQPSDATNEVDEFKCTPTCTVGFTTVNYPKPPNPLAFFSSVTTNNGIDCGTVISNRVECIIADGSDYRFRAANSNPLTTAAACVKDDSTITKLIMSTEEPQSNENEPIIVNNNEQWRMLCQNSILSVLKVGNPGGNTIVRRVTCIGCQMEPPLPGVCRCELQQNREFFDFAGTLPVLVKLYVNKAQSVSSISCCNFCKTDPRCAAFTWYQVIVSITVFGKKIIISITNFCYHYNRQPFVSLGEISFKSGAVSGILRDCNRPCLFTIGDADIQESEMEATAEKSNALGGKSVRCHKGICEMKMGTVANIESSDNLCTDSGQLAKKTCWIQNSNDPTKDICENLSNPGLATPSLPPERIQMTCLVGGILSVSALDNDQDELREFIEDAENVERGFPKSTPMTVGAETGTGGPNSRFPIQGFKCINNCVPDNIDKSITCMNEIKVSLGDGIDIRDGNPTLGESLENTWAKLFYIMINKDSVNPELSIDACHPSNTFNPTIHIYTACGFKRRAEEMADPAKSTLNCLKVITDVCADENAKQTVDSGEAYIIVISESVGTTSPEPREVTVDISCTDENNSDCKEKCYVLKDDKP